MTSSAPMARFSTTVVMVALTSCERSRATFATMPGGRLSLISRSLSPTARGDGAAVLAGQHQGGADHDLIAVLAGGARAQLAADPDVADVLDAHRNAVARCDDRARDLVHRADAGIGAHEIGFARALDVVRADREIRRFQRSRDIGIGNAIGGELGGIGLDDILLFIAAKRVDVGDARHGASAAGAESNLVPCCR